MSHIARDPSGHGRLDFEQLAQLFESWPNSREYRISDCDTVSVHSLAMIVVHFVLI